MKLMIEKAIYGGAGLARHEGKAVFVPFTLPGEVVEARIASDRGSYAETELEAIITTSPDRTTPPCAHFSICGGCHYQHATYAAQLAMKCDILRESFERAKVAERSGGLPEIEVLSGEPLGYRNRVRLHIDTQTGQLGYRKRGSHETLAIASCPIAAPLLVEAILTLNANSEAWGLSQNFTEIELFTNGDALLISLWAEDDARAAFARLWPMLEEALPGCLGAAVFSSERGKHASRLLTAAGEPGFAYHAAGREYGVSLGSFFQVNRYLIDPMVELVTADRSSGSAWDLYAGVGLFAQALGERFERVTAVESAPSSSADLRRNLQGKAQRTVKASTLDFLRGAAARKEKTPDLVVVDPPRAGLGKDVTSLLGKIGPRHITYVSCDPATLSRDVKSLLDSGYSLERLHMVDMFPETFHMESIVKLSRK
ncbi:class I SAM-dependent RNA methyltransferase [Silvibacterium dinghuense]|uniref:Class I SAM-dependent RNA methyltransferase n=1 Tax=Silvibacterium dinghuense TaxID=1560006 RepID=A0A4Q1SIN1_9BACT|nr:class I SAM-dependent RNA methyltransferase [Silvibacterium dinghuense]RXS97090.1 class I SAM-dependent RNA methyltransferase [Silvibacterium dinghuense]GGG96118.1 putative RNA methyltransferase [Silvibacterium dinghuense]